MHNCFMLLYERISSSIELKMVTSRDFHGPSNRFEIDHLMVVAASSIKACKKYLLFTYKMLEFFPFWLDTRYKSKIAMSC